MDEKRDSDKSSQEENHGRPYEFSRQAKSEWPAFGTKKRKELDDQYPGKQKDGHEWRYGDAPEYLEIVLEPQEDESDIKEDR
ncbi:MAG: hypothetical protein WCB96_05760 [Candidatus Aminicenantales bacterium]